MVCAVDQGVLEGGGFFLCEPDWANTVDRAGGKTQFTSGAISCRNGVHELSGTNDGINRARLDAKRAPNAFGFINDDRLGKRNRVEVGVQLVICLSRCAVQLHKNPRTPRVAPVRVASPTDDGFGKLATRGVTTTLALELGQQRVDSRS